LPKDRPQTQYIYTTFTFIGSAIGEKVKPPFLIHSIAGKNVEIVLAPILCTHLNFDHNQIPNFKRKGEEETGKGKSKEEKGEGRGRNFEKKGRKPGTPEKNNLSTSKVRQEEHATDTTGTLKVQKEGSVQKSGLQVTPTSLHPNATMKVNDYWCKCA
jgi:hypothetical protein